MIVHEVVVAGGDSNRERGGLEGSLPLSGAPALLDARVALGLDTSVSLACGLARSLFGSVGVVALRNHSVAVNVVVESIAHETTIATIVTGGSAVNKLLLREVMIVSGLDLVKGLKLGDRGESPA